MKESESPRGKLGLVFGDMKFIFSLLAIFILLMIGATSLESFFGTDFIGRAVYKSKTLVFFQSVLLLSIVASIFRRFSFQKKHIGIHIALLGVLIIGTGALISFTYGKNGTMALYTNKPKNTVISYEDLLSISNLDDGKTTTEQLPYTAFPITLNLLKDSFTVANYLPFADDKLIWKKSNNQLNSSSSFPSSTYLITNDHFSKEFTMSLNPESNLTSRGMIGALKADYVPIQVWPCVGMKIPSKIFFWDSLSQTCGPLEKFKLKLTKTPSGHRQVIYEKKNQKYFFYPDISSQAYDHKMQISHDIHSKVYNSKSLQSGSHMVYFGKSVGYFDRLKLKWIINNFEKIGKEIFLPWQNSSVSLVRHEDALVPFNVPRSVFPRSSNGRQVNGNLRALSIITNHEEHWLTNERPLLIDIKSKKFKFEIIKNTFTSPFYVKLDDSQLVKNSETNYESEAVIELIKDSEKIKSSISLNNPINYKNYKFYVLSSFDQLRSGQIELSVNYDPGRWIKYLGAFCILIGCLWHFLISKLYKKYCPKK